jgi:hypothetical protein
VTGKKPDARIRICYQDLLDLDSWDLIFDSGGTWQLRHLSGKYALIFQSLFSQPNTYQQAIFEDNFQKGEVILIKDKRGNQFLINRPVCLEVLLVNLLALNQGIMLHACAVNDGGKGWIFPGVSGAGKSTMSRLWAGRENVTILNDERVILRKHQDDYWVYGTPWHGEEEFISANAVPVEGIFILRHSSKTQAVQIKLSDSITQLFVRSFPAFWNPTGMKLTLDFLAGLSQSVQCYDLGFRPEEGIVNYVRDWGESQAIRF